MHLSVQSAVAVADPAIFSPTACLVPEPPKEPKILARYPNIESKGSIRSIILAILEVQVVSKLVLGLSGRLSWECDVGELHTAEARGQRNGRTSERWGGGRPAILRQTCNPKPKPGCLC